jgi:hypothetical protein
MATRVGHCKRESYDIYIGRPSILGNPFTTKAKSIAKVKVDTKDESLASFEEYARDRITKDPAFKKAILDCKDKTLGCWCAPRACHGHIIARLVEELSPNK